MAGFKMRKFVWNPTNWKSINFELPYTEWDPDPERQGEYYNSDTYKKNGVFDNTLVMKTETYERVRIILKKTAQMLIDTETGWQLDPQHYEGKTDLKTVMDADLKELKGNSSSSVKSSVYCVYLKSVTDDIPNGEKLLLGYSCYPVQLRSSYGFLPSSSYTYAAVSGLFSSMLPANTADKFMEEWDVDGFIPMNATPIHHSGKDSSMSTNLSSYCMANKTTGSDTYHVQVITNGHIVAFRLYRNVEFGTIWFQGPLVGTLAHPDVDAAPYAKMSSFSFTNPGGETSNPSYAGTTATSGSFSSSDSTYMTWHRDVNDYITDIYERNMFFAANGDRHKDDKGIFWSSPVDQLSNMISDSSVVGFNRWVAIYVGIASSDPSVTNVVRGDGMKGYFDTNFIRHVRNTYSVGQTFDDGNFVFIGNGTAMGWDPSNGPLLN